MDLQKAILEFFNPQNQYETIALVILLGGSFLLGMLLWFLIFHLPKSIRLNRELRQKTNALSDLEKKHAHLSEDFKIVSAKVENLETDLKNAQNQVVEQTTKLVASRNETEQVKSQLYRAQKSEAGAIEELSELKRLYKYAQQAITDAEKLAENTRNDRDLLQSQLDRLKPFVIQIETDKQELTQKLQDTRNRLEEAQVATDECERELRQTQEELEELRKQMSDNQQVSSQNSELQQQLNELSQAVKELQQQKNEAVSQLSVFTEKENQEKEAALNEQQLMDNHLQNVSDNMETNPFFAEIDPEELIEDKALLEQNLQTKPVFTQPFEEEIHEISQAEEESFSQLLRQAENALEMPGLYNEIDQTAFIPNPDEHLTDEERIDKMLAMVESQLQESDLHREITEEELVENPQMLSENLQKANSATQEEEEETIVLIQMHEAEQMDKMLESAQLALNSAAFYNEIPAEQLIETQNQQEIPTDPKYKTDIEKAVVRDLPRAIPPATEAQKDDLQQIAGIGGFIEQKLNHLGIFTYEQVACFDETFISKLTAAIGFAPDAIYRDNWVEQARQLYAKQKLNRLTNNLDKNKQIL